MMTVEPEHMCVYAGKLLETPRRSPGRIRMRMRVQCELAFVWLAVLSIVLVACDVSARTYHVDPAKGSDSFSGSETEPFKTVRRVSEILQPGDTAVLHEGVYHEQVMGGQSGREGSPITYVGTDREKVIFQGSVLVKDWKRVDNVWVKQGLRPITPTNCFVMIDEKHLLKKADSAFKLQEGSYHLDRSGTYTIRLVNDADPNRDHTVEVYELDFAFNAGNRWGGTAKNWIVLRNLTFQKYGTYAISGDLKHAGDSSHWELDGLTVRLNHSVGVFACLDDWFVHDCSFMRNGSHGCQIDGARVRFLNNVSAENEWFGPTGDGGCGVIIGPDASGNSCIVRENRLADNGDPLGYGCGVYLEGRSHGNVIDNNTITGNTHAGLGCYGSSFNLIVNNVLVDIAPTCDWEIAAAFVVGHSYEGEATQSAGNLVAYNTVWGCPAGVAALPPTDRIEEGKRNRFINNVFARYRFLSPLPAKAELCMEANAWFPADSGDHVSALRRWLKPLGDDSEKAAGNVTGKDPGFRDPTKGNFRPHAHSPLIHAGVEIADITRDRDGHGRPCGHRPTIGAYEFCDEN